VTVHEAPLQKYAEPALQFITRHGAQAVDRVSREFRHSQSAPRVPAVAVVEGERDAVSTENTRGELTERDTRKLPAFRVAVPDQVREHVQLPTCRAYPASVANRCALYASATTFTSCSQVLQHHQHVLPTR